MRAPDDALGFHADSPDRADAGADDALLRLRTGIDSGETTRGELDRVGELMQRLSDPARVAGPGPRNPLPWSPQAKAVKAAEQASIDARLEVFQDDLKSIRAANRILNRISMAHAVETARAAIFEIRARGELVRYEILNETHRELTSLFLSQIESIESLRDRMPAEMLDAMKERALNEFTAKMNRVSRAEAALSKIDPARLKE